MLIGIINKPMISATIELGPGRENVKFSALSIAERCRSCTAEVLLCRGGRTVDKSSTIPQIRGFAEEPCSKIEIAVSGKNDLVVACGLFDYFSHGAGI
jgi:hypothetical protein